MSDGLPYNWAIQQRHFRDFTPFLDFVHAVERMHEAAHMESLVKEINARVKGTEKFWNDGPSAEAILQLRAAVLCDDDRLSTYLGQATPSTPTSPRR